MILIAERSEANNHVPGRVKSHAMVGLLPVMGVEVVMGIGGVILELLKMAKCFTEKLESCLYARNRFAYPECLQQRLSSHVFTGQPRPLYPASS